MSRRVIVFRSTLLPGSETFVRNQADSLTRWSPTYVGFVRAMSPLARAGDTIVFQGRFATLRSRMAKLLGSSPAFTRVLRRLDADVIHAHFGFDGVVAMGAASRAKTPMVVTFHGVDATAQAQAPGLRGRLYRRRLGVLFRRAAVLIAVSQPIAERVLALGAPANKLVVHHIGIPIPEASTEASLDRSGVLFVGRCTEKKGIEDLIRAYALLPQEVRERQRLTVVGDGPLRESLERLAHDEDVLVDFVGAQAPDQVQRRMRESAVMVVPSKTAANGDTEGLPMVVLEAGAAGVPVLAYAHSGIPEAVVPGVTGVLVAEGDVAGLARELEALLADEDGRTQMGQAARQHIEQNFDIRAQARKLEELYDRAVSAG